MDTKAIAVGKCTVFLVLHTSAEPSREEWSRLVDSYNAYAEKHGGNLSDLRVLVVSDGGGPDGAKRQQITKIWGTYTPRIAVITDSIVIRGVVTALNWFNPGTKAFAPGDLAGALKALDLPGDARRDVLNGFASMQTQMHPVRCLELVSK